MKKRTNQDFFFNTTLKEVVGRVDFVTPLSFSFLPIEITLLFGNCCLICNLNCFLDLKPKNCFTTINNSQNQSLNNFGSPSQRGLI